MKCAACKTGTMKESTTTYFVQAEDLYIIVENVPCLKCDLCGEEFFKTSVAKRLEQIVHKIKRNTERVQIIDYAA